MKTLAAQLALSLGFIGWLGCSMEDEHYRDRYLNLRRRVDAETDAKVDRKKEIEATHYSIDGWCKNCRRISQLELPKGMSFVECRICPRCHCLELSPLVPHWVKINDRTYFYFDKCDGERSEGHRFWLRNMPEERME